MRDFAAVEQLLHRAPFEAEEDEAVNSFSRNNAQKFGYPKRTYAKYVQGV